MVDRRFGGAGTPRGLSLVELLVVVGILGLMIAIAKPAFRQTLEDAALKSKARQLNAMMRLAHAEAVAQRQFVALEFDLRAYPEPDRVRLISDAQWSSADSRWEGSTMRGETPLVVEGQLDIAYLAMGASEFDTGIHSLVVNPAGVVGFNDGPLTDEWDIMLEIPSS